MTDFDNRWRKYSDIKKDKKFIERYMGYTFLVFPFENETEFPYDEESVMYYLESMIGKNVRLCCEDFQLYDLSPNGNLIDEDGDRIEDLDPFFDNYLEVFAKPLVV